MPSPLQVSDAQGHPVQLGEELGRGGEGAVYRVANDANVVAKIYHTPVTGDKAAKLRLLTRVVDTSLTQIAAWPISLLQTRGGQVIGFTMPNASGYKPVYRIYSPIQRQIDFPTVDWSHLIHVARNAATAFKVIHERSHVVGDVNQSNIQVSSKGIVKLIDCDSFQVHDGTKVFLCEVGVGHFTPPELQGKSFETTERTQNHDCFGLAVLIFHLLFSGRHPFSGRYRGKGDLPIEQAIENRLFAYSRKGGSPLLLPPPLTLTLQDVSPTIADMFECAFLARSESRPPAATWKTALEDLKTKLADCTRYKGHRFYKSGHECPWCAIVQDGGPDFFITIHANAIRATVFDFVGLWNEVQRIPEPPHQVPPPPSPTLQKVPALTPCPLPALFAAPYTSPPGAVAAAIPREMRAALWLESTALAGTLVFCVLGTLLAFSTVISLPIFIARLAPTGSFMIAALASIVTAMASRKCAKTRRERNETALNAHAAATSEMTRIQTLVTQLSLLQAKVDHAHRLWQETTTQLTQATNAVVQYIHKVQLAKWKAWEQECRARSDRRAQILTSLDQQKRLYEDNERQEKRELQKLEENRRTQQLEAHLRNHTISEARISGIGGGLKRTLISFGIQTAADFDLCKIARCPGFGATRIQTLVHWRQSVEQSFRFDPRKGIDPIAEANVRMRFNTKRKQIIQQVGAGKTALQELFDRGGTDCARLGNEIVPTAIPIPDGMQQLIEQTRIRQSQTEAMCRDAVDNRTKSVRQIEDALAAVGPVLENAGTAIVAHRAMLPRCIAWLGGRRRVVVGKLWQAHAHRFDLRFACPACKQYLAADASDCNSPIVCPNCAKPLTVPKPW